MNYLPKTTLAYFRELPHLKCLDFSNITCAELATNCRSEYNKGVTVKPEAAAIEFYTLNHLASYVSKHFTAHEELPDWALATMQAYTQCLQKQGMRALYYLCLITAREARHTNKNDKWKTVKAHLDKTYSPAVAKHIESTFGGGTLDTAAKWMDYPPECTVTQYFSGLWYVFNHASFGIHFGGKKWGEVAAPLMKFLTGQISMEIMLDTSFTLAHNTSPIYNKGMFYEHHQQYELFHVLDIQRSGQMPQAVLQHGGSTNPYKNNLSYFISQDLYELVKLFKANCPDAFEDAVDYYKVEAMGAVQSYPALKAAQKKKGGKKVIVDGNELMGSIDILPGVSVQIVKRAKLIQEEMV